MTTKTVKGTLWFSANEPVYTGFPTATYPSPAKYSGGLDRGRIMELLEVFTTYNGAIWIKFAVANTEGIKATLYIPRYSTSYGRAEGTQVLTCVPLQRYTPLPDGVMEMAVRILLDGEIRSEPSGSAAVKAPCPKGTLFPIVRWVDAIDGYVETIYMLAATGTPTHGFMDCKQPSPKISDGQVYERIVLFEGSWADVGVVIDDPVIPDPDPDPDPVVPGTDAADAAKYRALKAAVKELLA